MGLVFLSVVVLMARGVDVDAPIIKFSIYGERVMLKVWVPNPIERVVRCLRGFVHIGNVEVDTLTKEGFITFHHPQECVPGKVGSGDERIFDRVNNVKGDIKG